ncbi:MAG: glycosyltransferase [Clostridia bacterium]|nr:glycosyltransferase [Clostridia bacterium]
MKLSVIIPMYNESSIVCDTIRTLDGYLSTVYPQEEYELIFVSDGSKDDCAEKAKGLCNEIPSLRVEGYPQNHGKGHAVRWGMVRAKGDIRLFTDCDLAYGVEIIPEFVRRFEESENDIMIGSRNLDKRGHESYTLLRMIMSKIYFKLICFVTGFKHSDSQCGIKCFSGEAAEAIFSRCIIDGFAFDLEALMRADKMGYKVGEVPVKIINHRESKVHVVRDTIRMLKDVKRIKKAMKAESK